MEAADSMRACPVDSVRPYALMPAPVYVFLRANEKFVSVKAPLDFFTPEELKRLRKFDSFYMPRFVEEVEQYRVAARAVRGILKSAHEESPAIGRGRGAVATLSLTPFEVSDAVLRVLGPLWNVGGVIEVFFVAHFCEELCAPLPLDLVNAARDRSVENFERGLLLAAAVTFLALHLGYSDLDFLNVLRFSTFEHAALSAPVALSVIATEVNQLTRELERMLRETSYRELRADLLANRPTRVTQRLTSRLQRIDEALVSRERVAPSIYGERGFADV